MMTALVVIKISCSPKSHIYFKNQNGCKKKFAFTTKDNVLYSHCKGVLVKKSELIEAIATDADVSKTVATKMFDSTIDQITKALKHGEEVSIIGFGTFSVKNRAERSGRNPQTGEVIKIEAARVPSFKAGKALKDAVSEKMMVETI